MPVISECEHHAKFGGHTFILDTGWSMQLGKIADAVLTMEKIEDFQTLLQSHTIISAQCQIQYLHASSSNFKRHNFLNPKHTLNYGLNFVIPASY